jgi:hypothetical protein
LANIDRGDIVLSGAAGTLYEGEGRGWAGAAPRHSRNEGFL